MKNRCCQVASPGEDAPPNPPGGARDSRARWQLESIDGFAHFTAAVDSVSSLHAGSLAHLLAVAHIRLDVVAHFTTAVKPGVVWMPMHFAEARANLLTNDAGDPEIGTPEYKVCAVRMEKLAG